MPYHLCNFAPHQSLFSHICLALFWWAISGRFIRQFWPNSVRPEKQPDRNTAVFQPVKPNMTQLESQTTRRRFGWESLSTSQISWDMCHDLFSSPINKNSGAPIFSPSPLLSKPLPIQGFPFSTSTPRKLHGKQQQQASGRRRGRREPCRCLSEAVIIGFFATPFSDLFPPLPIFLCFSGSSGGILPRQ
jgi:hypothetical protein